MERLKSSQFWLTFVAGILILIVALIVGRELSGDNQEKLLAIREHTGISLIIIAGLFLLKSIAVVVIPAVPVYIASGILLPLSLAIPVVFLCVGLEFCLNYYMGKLWGQTLFLRAITKLSNKYDKFNSLVEKQQTHQKLTIYLLRFIPGAPINLTSVIIGASRFNFIDYMWCSMMGVMPKVLLSILSGSLIVTSFDKSFVIAFALFLIITIISIIYLIKIYRDKNSKDITSDLI